MGVKFSYTGQKRRGSRLDVFWVLFATLWFGLLVADCVLAWLR